VIPYDHAQPVESTTQKEMMNADMSVSKSHEQDIGGLNERRSPSKQNGNNDKNYVKEPLCLEGIREDFKPNPSSREILEEKQRARYDIRLCEELYLCMRNEERNDVKKTTLIETFEKRPRDEGSPERSWFVSTSQDQRKATRCDRIKSNAELVRSAKEWRDGAKLRIAASRTNNLQQTRLVHGIESRIGLESFSAQNVRREMTSGALVEARRTSRGFEARRSADFSFARRFCGRTAACARAETRSAWSESIEDQGFEACSVISRRRNNSSEQQILNRRKQQKKTEDLRWKSAMDRAELETQVQVNEDLRREEARYRVSMASRREAEDGPSFCLLSGEGGSRKRVLALPIISTPATPPQVRV